MQSPEKLKFGTSCVPGMVYSNMLAAQVRHNVAHVYMPACVSESVCCTTASTDAYLHVSLQ